MTEFENNKRAEDAAAEKPAAPAQPATVPPLQGMPTPPQSAGQVPPAGNPYANASQPQQPSGQAPFYGAPAQQPQGAPQNMPGMPLLYLTGGMKFGWAVCGFFLGPIAILLAWLTNQSNFPQAKSEAVKFSLIGFLATFAVWVLVLVLFSVAACSAFTYGPSYYSYY